MFLPLLLAAACAAAPVDPLAARLGAAVAFEGTPRERELFDRLLLRVLESPAARDLAETLIAQGQPFAAVFAEMPGTAVYERRDGRMAFAAAEAAHLVREPHRGLVRLNRACLEIDADFADVDCARQLAHELLGHGLGWALAGAQGQRDAYAHFDDELFARLIEWLVRVDLAGEIRDPEPACALVDLEAYQRRMTRVYTGSVWGLRPEHMGRAREVYRERLGWDLDEKDRAKVAAALASIGDAEAAALERAASHPLFRRWPEREADLAARLRARGEMLLTGPSCDGYR